MWRKIGFGVVRVGDLILCLCFVGLVFVLEIFGC